MRENGTDRDIALQLLDAVTTAANLVTVINQNLYEAVVTTQPTDQTGAVGDTVQFTVAGFNIEAYQWQYRPTATGTWQNSSSTGYNTDTLDVEITEQRYAYYYRCRLTGPKGTYTYTDVVRLRRPATT